MGGAAVVLGKQRARCWWCIGPFVSLPRGGAAPPGGAKRCHHEQGPAGPGRGRRPEGGGPAPPAPAFIALYRRGGAWRLPQPEKATALGRRRTINLQCMQTHDILLRRAVTLGSATDDARVHLQAATPPRPSPSSPSCPGRGFQPRIGAERGEVHRSEHGWSSSFFSGSLGKGAPL